MKKELKEKWLEALRSGKYPKAKGFLCVTDGTGSPVGYCCLGVLCDILQPEKWERGFSWMGTEEGAVPVKRHSELAAMLDIRIQIETGLDTEIVDDEDVFRESIRISGVLAGVNDRVDTFDPVIELIEKLVPVDEEVQTNV